MSPGGPGPVPRSLAGILTEPSSECVVFVHIVQSQNSGIFASIFIASFEPAIISRRVPACVIYLESNPTCFQSSVRLSTLDAISHSDTMSWILATDEQWPAYAARPEQALLILLYNIRYVCPQDNYLIQGRLLWIYLAPIASWWTDTFACDVVPLRYTLFNYQFGTATNVKPHNIYSKLDLI